MELEHAWPWYIAGPLIGLFVPLLYIIANKAFGISGTFDHICSLVVPKSKKDQIRFDARKNSWKLSFVIGIAIGAGITQFFLSPQYLSFLPEMYFGWKGYMTLFVGGLFVGFGTRYASGCTSGHAITGLSLLNAGSLKSTISFFATGALFTWLIYLMGGWA